MTYEEAEQLEQMYEKYYDLPYDSPDEPKWDKLEDKEKPFECQQVCAVMFLYNKLKPEEKAQDFFFHGEHDILYIGNSYDIFEPFTEEEVRLAYAYGISLDDENGGFTIYASM